MGKTFGQIVSYMNQPEPDGSVVVHAAATGGKPFEVRIEPQDVPKLLGLLQRAMIEMSQGTDRELIFQEATIDHIQLAFGGGEVAVLVSTDQIGTIALQGTEEAFRVLSAMSQEAMEIMSAKSH